TAAAIAGLAPHVTLALEMFPRRVQPVLDRWVDGELDERAFLAESDWAHVWGFDAELYLPLFRFARTDRIPMRAVNVERARVHRVATEGWASVPIEAREGVDTPAPAAPAYRERLVEAWRAHRPAGAAEDDAAVARFVEAQLTWDRALATGIVAALRERPG